jgi:hypothetical protein
MHEVQPGESGASHYYLDIWHIDIWYIDFWGSIGCSHQKASETATLLVRRDYGQCHM